MTIRAARLESIKRFVMGTSPNSVPPGHSHRDAVEFLIRRRMKERPLASIDCDMSIVTVP